MTSGVASAILIAGLGLGTLGGLRLQVNPDAAEVAVIVPPWRPAGLAQVAGFGLPVIDLLWDGHVAVVDLSGDPAALQHLRDAGAFLLDADGVRACLGAEQRITGET